MSASHAQPKAQPKQQQNPSKSSDADKNYEGFDKFLYNNRSDEKEAKHYFARAMACTEKDDPFNYEGSIELAAKHGHPEALYRLSLLCLKSKSLNRNPANSLRFLHLSADKGYLIAQLQLGSDYLNGFNREVYEDATPDVNFKKAFKYLALAALQDDSSAKIQLAKCFIHGIGTEKDKQKGLELLMDAARHNPDALYLLGKCYVHGEIVGIKNVNPEKAFRLYQLAAVSGSSYALQGLGMSYLHGNGVKINEKFGSALIELSLNVEPYLVGNDAIYDGNIGIGAAVDRKHPIIPPYNLFFLSVSLQTIN